MPKQTKAITQSELVEFANLSSTSSYDHERKTRYKNLGRKILKSLVQLIGLNKEEYDIRWNPGGVAVSGDHTLHTDKFYLALHDNLGSGWFYYRTCQGRKDFTGGPNQIYNWTALTAYGLVPLADKLKDIQSKT